MSQSKKLSNDAEVILAYIKKFLKLRGYAPSQAEIALNTSNSKYIVSKALIELQQSGYVKKERNKSRTITVTGLRIVEVQ